MSSTEADPAKAGERLPLKTFVSSAFIVSLDDFGIDTADRTAESAALCSSALLTIAFEKSTASPAHANKGTANSAVTTPKLPDLSFQNNEDPHDFRGNMTGNN